MDRHMDGQADRQMDGQMYRQTDKAAYTDGKTHLKIQPVRLKGQPARPEDLSSWDPKGQAFLA